MTLQRKLQLLITTVFFSTLVLAAFILILLMSATIDPADRMTVTFAIGILLALALISAICALYILTIFLKPLDALKQFIASKSTIDDLSEIPDDITVLDNEIGAIAQAVRTIAEKNKQQYHSLESKIDRRTKAMEESKAKDEAIIKNIAEGLVVTDLERKIMFVNPAGEKMLGYKLFEVFERVWPDFLLVKDKRQEEVPLDKLAISRALATGRPTKVDITEHNYLMRKDGTSFPVLISAAPITVGDRKLGAVVVFRDVTKEIEVDKTKTEFVSLASHQLRTPLSTINWYTETILAGDVGELDEDQRPYFEQIYESTQRMIDLVNALLNVSRLEMGTFMVEPEIVAVPELLDGVLEELQPKINEKGLTVTKDIDGSIPPMQLDRQLTWIIFQNLLSNAVKYTPEKGTITVTFHSQPKGAVVANTEIEKDSVLITVSDTGYGIPSYQQDQIFSKLFRADNVREKETEGTGLGLYIIKSIVDHVEGQIWFDSVIDEGTTFYIAIPKEGMKQREGTKALSAGTYN